MRPVQAYIRPKAQGNELLLVSRIVVACFGMFTGVICIILFVVSVSHANSSPPFDTSFSSRKLAW